MDVGDLVEVDGIVCKLLYIKWNMAQVLILDDHEKRWYPLDKLRLADEE